MSAEEKKKLHTGSAEGKRTDSMMILHVGSNGDALRLPPRDSNVTIPTYKGSASGKTFPGTGRQVKLNAAYAEDGPTLLVRTIEYNTGLHIDHYVEIGFAGFANIVDAVGGVEMTLDQGFKDKYSGADFKAGKQTLNGEQALAFVRTRHAFAASDLQRTKNQQEVPVRPGPPGRDPGTVLNPFKLYPTMGSGLDSLTVSKDMSLLGPRQHVLGDEGRHRRQRQVHEHADLRLHGRDLVWDKAKVKTLVDELKNDQTVTVSSN